MSTKTVSVERAIALELIDRPASVRELDEEHVAALAGSIGLRGLIVPLVVRPVGERFELVAGFHRHAACGRAKLAAVPAVIREHDGESADRAAENVVRKQLSPLEERARWRRCSSRATPSMGQQRAGVGQAAGVGVSEDPRAPGDRAGTGRQRRSAGQRRRRVAGHRRRLTGPV